MTGEPPEVIDWRAFGPLLQDAQKRLARLEERLGKQEETIKIGFQLLHEDIFNSRAETRGVANRLAVVEATVREMEGGIRSMDAKLGLILAHLGLAGEPKP
jgi:uncharacterized coiled-coil protein SlyX